MNATPPDLPTHDSNLSKKKHGCLKTGAIGTVVVLLFFILAVILGSREVKRMADAVEPFFSEITAGNIRQAYEFTSKEFQENVGFETFSEMVAETGIDHYSSANWTYGSSGDRGDEAIEGSVLTTGGVKIPLRIDFVRSGDQRLISNISQLPPPEEAATLTDQADIERETVPVSDGDGKKKGWSVGFSWSTARIQDLRFVSSPKAGTDPAVFSSGVQSIQIEGDLKYAPSGTRIDVVWILEKSECGDIVDFEVTRSKLEAGSADISAYLERSGPFLYPGDWKVKVLIDGKEKASLPFKLEFSEQEFLEKAREGDADSQLAIGLYYLNQVEATPIQKDPVNAIKWLRASAAQGNSSAQFVTAELLLSRPELNDSEKTEVVDWLTKSSGQGNIGAQVLLGTVYQNGVLADRDLELAQKYYLQAAQQEHPRGQVLLGMLMLNFGKEEMKPEGIQWVRKAADQGDGEAILVLGQVHKLGIGVPRDLELAREYFQKAADAGRPEAVEELKSLNE